jgi:hypothetical protein
MKKIFVLLGLTIFLILSIGYISAVSDYQNHKACDITKTLVEGKIYSANAEPIGNADVTVVCTHNGNGYTQKTKSVNNGVLKGTYVVTFSQSNCIKGDSVAVTFMRNGQIGTAQGKVKDSIDSLVNGVCTDIDTAKIDVPMIDPPVVPEFGVVAGAVTVLSALTVFFVIRRK